MGFNVDHSKLIRLSFCHVLSWFANITNSKPNNLPIWQSVTKHTYCHALNLIPGFVTMTGMLISSLNLILTRTNLTFNKLLQKLSSFFSFLFLYLNDITFNLIFRASTLYLKGSYNPLIIKILNFT